MEITQSEWYNLKEDLKFELELYFGFRPYEFVTRWEIIEIILIFLMPLIACWNLTPGNLEIFL